MQLGQNPSSLPGARGPSRSSPGHLFHFISSFSPPLLTVLLILVSFLCAYIVKPFLLRSGVHTLSSVCHALHFYLFNKFSNSTYCVWALFKRVLRILIHLMHQCYEVSLIIILLLQMKKMKYTQVEWFEQFYIDHAIDEIPSPTN